MIVYFDTSALVKRYLVEEGSPEIEALWKQDHACHRLRDPL